MKHCVVCNKQIGDGEYDGQFCENDCDRPFCSVECADLESFEATFPNCCPGVYWCGLCKREYLDTARGHLFIPNMHDASPDLEMYLGTSKDYSNGAVVERCMNCNMWCYEVKSHTDVPGKYEGHACEVWLEDVIKPTMARLDADKTAQPIMEIIGYTNKLTPRNSYSNIEELEIRKKDYTKLQSNDSITKTITKQNFIDKMIEFGKKLLTNKDCK